MSENVGFAGQISPEQMVQVAEQGFKSVINNRPDMEGGPEQPTSAQIEEAARTAGLDYVFQPVIAGQLTEVDTMNSQNLFSCFVAQATVQIIYIKLQSKWTYLTTNKRAVGKIQVIVKLM